jgi:hypothetical protein
MSGVSMNIDLQDRVLATALHIAGGDASKADRWYREARLAEFNGKTPLQLIAEGRGADLLQLLETYEAGPLG